MYWQDFAKGNPRDAGGNLLWWRYQGASGTDTPDIRICPVAKRPQAVSYKPGAAEGAPINPGTAANCWSTSGFAPDPQTEFRGSYALNAWLYPEFRYLPLIKEYYNCFPSAESVQYPTRTPVFSDAIWSEVTPHKDDLAARDLFLGAPLDSWNVRTLPIGLVAIARHGSRPPGSAPRDWPPKQPPPRAWGINVSFTDGHAEPVKLPDLWTLTWNLTWESPAPAPPWRP